MNYRHNILLWLSSAKPNKALTHNTAHRILYEKGYTQTAVLVNMSQCAMYKLTCMYECICMDPNQEESNRQNYIEFGLLECKCRSRCCFCPNVNVYVCGSRQAIDRNEWENKNHRNIFHNGLFPVSCGVCVRRLRWNRHLIELVFFMCKAHFGEQIFVEPL